MSNKRRKKRTPGRKSKKALSKIWIISVVVAAILIAVIAIAAAYIKKMEKSGSEKPDSAGEMGERITFPYELADGKLKVASLFQYSGLNPDCNNEEGDDIAALEIVNQSDEFCRSAEIQVVMQDGTELLFKAQSWYLEQRIFRQAGRFGCLSPAINQSDKMMSAKSSGIILNLKKYL